MTESARSGHYPWRMGAPALDLGSSSLVSLAVARPRSDDVRAAPSFESVYEACFDTVWGSLRRLGVPSASLDDALQDVFLTVHRRLGEFEGRSSIKTWVLGITLRVASDHRRRARRKGDLVELPKTVPDEAPGPFERVEQAEALARLDRALARLDEDKRAMFVLVEIEEMSAPEAAALLGIKLNTAYSRLRAARRSFEQALLDIRKDEQRRSGASAGVVLLQGALPAAGVTGKAIAAGLLIAAVAFGAGFFAGRSSVEPAPSTRPALAPAASEAHSSAATGEDGASADTPPSAASDPAQPPEPPGPASPSSSAKAPARDPSGAPRPGAHADSTSSPAESASSLSAELALLREARRALQDESPERALEWLDELARRHPQGLLREERMAARILALCAANRVDDARADAQRFLKEAPRSLHAERVRASCATHPAK